jgi:hypothetical protein
MGNRDASRPMDTAPDAHALQIDAVRRMGPESRARLAFEMSDEIRSISAEGVRRRHPEYDERSVERAVATLYLGPELASAVWPGEALLRP